MLGLVGGAYTPPWDLPCMGFLPPRRIGRADFEIRMLRSYITRITRTVLRAPDGEPFGRGRRWPRGEMGLFVIY